MLKLFYAEPSCAAIVRMALEEVGADYELSRISLVAGDQRKPDYLALNPKGKVPTLVTANGVLTEVGAILLYLAQTFPKARLAPLQDTWRLARMMSFNAFIASSVHVILNQCFRAEKHLTAPASQMDMRTKAAGTLRDYFGIIQTEMGKGPWVLGDVFSAADTCLCFYSRLAARFDWFAEYPQVAAHLTAMKARPSYDATFDKSFRAQEDLFLNLIGTYPAFGYDVRLKAEGGV